MSSTRIVSTLSKKPIWLALDDVGVYLGLARNNNESNASYRKRILRKFNETTNSTYQGLTNAINLEFDFGRFEGPIITPPSASCDIIVTSSTLLLSDETTDFVIPFIYTNATGHLDFLSLDDVVDEINSCSGWSAVLTDATDGSVPAFTLLRQENTKSVFNFEIMSSQFIDLGETNIVEYSVASSDPVAFKTYIPLTGDTPYDLFSEKGDFSVDLDNGYVYLKTPPADGSFVNFQYKISPYTLICSPSTIRSFDDSEFISALYYGTTPSVTLIEFINELFQVSRQTWGE